MLLNGDIFNETYIILHMNTKGKQVKIENFVFSLSRINCKIPLNIYIRDCAKRSPFSSVIHTILCINIWKIY